MSDSAFDDRNVSRKRSGSFTFPVAHQPGNSLGTFGDRFADMQLMRCPAEEGRFEDVRPKYTAVELLCWPALEH